MRRIEFEKEREGDEALFYSASIEGVSIRIKIEGGWGEIYEVSARGRSLHRVQKLLEEQGRVLNTCALEIIQSAERIYKERPEAIIFFIREKRKNQPGGG